jgi:hypothetical protein
MLELVQQYVAEKPRNNILAPYLKGLHACADAGDTVADTEYVPPISWSIASPQ